ncbi:MAG TPA: DUF721 domain-containing protein [Zoogloea sp.]|uniref:DUF721 domain-containing protein n=1 Tax=Zoogloea sp. TaxID=49181 RepID=UPI002BA4ED59|nr:DUF721 domain-containing protein [Zoogloea sp.]HMV16271.1 DUF721 domain-containing protein [Rhodocyclaceae bacterium]HMV62646.1 DUF721 domain-containing protein [Rhodocyclaceae bacterium]HMW50719.1 DUF721 domain-containing protein [Rhodocyclaceae bacterium]HMZ75357.1 DUF721 domain-containing protein [Rhodocyclaceae bacterium]HNA68139.1 DUF721 domain-containing protein [Rhodocyclaceae bacterium]
MARALDAYLDRGDTLARLHAHAARLLRLQRTLSDVLPDYLAASCQVANLKDEVLVIHTRGAAVAVKLRQAIPGLLADFARAGVALRDIKVKVAAPESPRPAAAPVHRSVSDGTRAGLDELAGRLPADSPLAQALRRFVRSAG